MQGTRVWPLGWKMPWRREWQPTPVFMPGEFHGQRKLVGHSSWSHKESDTTERLTLSQHAYTWVHSEVDKSKERVNQTSIPLKLGRDLSKGMANFVEKWQDKGNKRELKRSWPWFRHFQNHLGRKINACTKMSQRQRKRNISKRLGNVWPSGWSQSSCQVVLWEPLGGMERNHLIPGSCFESPSFYPGCSVGNYLVFSPLSYEVSNSTQSFVIVGKIESKIATLFCHFYTNGKV